jgi:hypothetical protein
LRNSEFLRLRKNENAKSQSQQIPDQTDRKGVGDNIDELTQLLSGEPVAETDRATVQTHLAGGIRHFFHQPGSASATGTLAAGCSRGLGVFTRQFGKRYTHFLVDDGFERPPAEPQAPAGAALVVRDIHPGLALHLTLANPALHREPLHILIKNVKTSFQGTELGFPGQPHLPRPMTPVTCTIGLHRGAPSQPLAQEHPVGKIPELFRRGLAEIARNPEIDPTAIRHLVGDVNEELMPETREKKRRSASS